MIHLSGCSKAQMWPRSSRRKMGHIWSDPNFPESKETRLASSFKCLVSSSIIAGVIICDHHNEKAGKSTTSFLGRAGDSLFHIFFSRMRVETIFFLMTSHRFVADPHSQDASTPLSPEELSQEDRGAYILMQRIMPGLQPSVMTRQGQLKAVFLG